MNTIFSTKAVRLAYGRTLMDNGSSLMTTNGHDFTEPDDGFMVGGVASETKIPLDICDGCIVFDVSERVDHSREAYNLCKERDEDAYYDSKKMKTVFTSESVPVTRNVEHEEA